MLFTAEEHDLVYIYIYFFYWCVSDNNSNTCWPFGALAESQQLRKQVLRLCLVEPATFIQFILESYGKYTDNTIQSRTDKKKTKADIYTCTFISNVFSFTITRKCHISIRLYGFPLHLKWTDDTLISPQTLFIWSKDEYVTLHDMLRLRPFLLRAENHNVSVRMTPSKLC